MIDPFEKGKAWFMYEKLEKEFIATISYVALESVHNNVWSEKYGGLLVRIGDMVDSFFRLMVNSKSLDNEEKVRKLRGLIVQKRREKKDWYPDISNFRKTFNSIFELSSVEVEAHYGLTDYGKLQPFKDFDKKKPFWWESYNKVKHEIFEQIEKKATLGNTINALGGLFVLSILHKESQQYLIRHTNVISGLKFLRKKDLESFLSKSMIGVFAGEYFEIKAETPLFTHIFRIDKELKSKPKTVTVERP